MLMWQIPQRKIPHVMTEAWVHLSHLKGKHTTQMHVYPLFKFQHLTHLGDFK